MSTLLFKKGHIPWNKGIKYSEEYKKRLAIQIKSPQRIEWEKQNPDGTKKQYDIYARKIRRHLLGISKKYRNEYSRITHTEEYRKRHHQKYNAMCEYKGKLTVETIQHVYEDNIKRYGTLTCIYCLNPIEFGKDTLEHKISASHGGTNEYNNLAIACRKCNRKKASKTEEEFRKELC